MDTPIPASIQQAVDTSDPITVARELDLLFDALPPNAVLAEVQAASDSFAGALTRIMERTSPHTRSRPGGSK